MISCRFLDKNEVQRLLPQLFSILHGNMSVIAPTGNSYDEDYALWSGAVGPPCKKENRRIVLIFSRDTLIGYLQYYTNGETFMIEGAQAMKKKRSDRYDRSSFHLLRRQSFLVVEQEQRFSAIGSSAD